MTKPTGRPRNAVSHAVEAAIRAAGNAGLTLEEIRQALPTEKKFSIKGAAYNLRSRHGFKSRSLGRIAVFYAPGAINEQSEALFKARVDAARALTRLRALVHMKRYREKCAAEDKAKRDGKADEAAKLRAQRKAQAAKELQDRKDLQAEKAAEKVKLRAAQVAEMAATNRVARRIKGDGTRGAPKASAGPATEDWSKAKVTIAPRTPGRYEVLESPGPFSSMRPGQYAFPAFSGAAKALS